MIEDIHLVGQKTKGKEVEPSSTVVMSFFGK